MTSCSSLEPVLSAYLDGELDEITRRAVASHLASCDSCRESAEGLERVKRAVAGLPMELAPERDLWPGIDAAITAATVVPFGRRTLQSAWSRWVLPVAAAAALVVVTATVTTRLQTRTAERIAATGQPPAGELQPAGLKATMVTASFTAARRELLRTLDARRASLDPATVTSVEGDVRIIDEAVRRIEAALAREPANSGLQRLLLTAYQQELDLLRAATTAPIPG